MAASLSGASGRVTGAVRRNRPWMTGWGTAARSSVQRPQSTSVKSISARSLRPKVRSRLRRPISMSMQSTRWPSAARQEATPPVMEVFPVPPFPDVITIAVDIGSLPLFDVNTISYFHSGINGFLCRIVRKFLLQRGFLYLCPPAGVAIGGV